jgi:hypothetical protein
MPTGNPDSSSKAGQKAWHAPLTSRRNDATRGVVIGTADEGARERRSMAVNIVSSGDGQAQVIRDHLVPLVRKHGTLEVRRDAMRLIAWQVGGLLIQHWTPFYDLAPGQASSPGYRHAIAQ